MLISLLVLSMTAALAIHLTSAPKTSTLTDTSAITVDISNADQGYISVRHAATDRKLMVRITQGDLTESYPLNSDGEFDAFPLTRGSGSYSVYVFENTSGSEYIQAYSGSLKADIEDENSCYLYPNVYVAFTDQSAAVQKSNELCQGLESDKDKVNAIWKFVASKITYDYIKALKVESHYVPDVDETLSSRKGICFDYASLLACMLRAQDIPTQLIFGTIPDSGEYHAWDKVLIGDSWLKLDPTYARSGDDLKDYIEEHCY